jgi:hypothetical protein
VPDLSEAGEVQFERGLAVPPYDIAEIHVEVDPILLVQSVEAFYDLCHHLLHLALVLKLVFSHEVVEVLASDFPCNSKSPLPFLRLHEDVRDDLDIWVLEMAILLTLAEQFIKAGLNGVHGAELDDSQVVGLAAVPDLAGEEGRKRLIDEGVLAAILFG